MKKEFPVLFGPAANGKPKQWNIYVDTDSSNKVWMCTEYGRINGKIQTHCQEIKDGKNKGRKNETTAYEQACFEAQSKWNKKKDRENYTETLQETTNSILIRPMLAKIYEKMKQHVMYPCFTQPKLDGCRAMAHILDDGTFELISRKGMSFPHLYRIKQALAIRLHDLSPMVYLDGELFTKQLRFEEISGIVRKETLTPSDTNSMEKVEYHVYDLVDLSVPEMTFEMRNRLLSDLISPFENDTVVLVQTQEAINEKTILEHQKQYVKDGYEGTIIRNKMGSYRLNYRSSELLKLKDVVEDDFQIVDVEKEKGTNDVAIFVCEYNGPDNLFRVRPEGTEEYRHWLWENKSIVIGKVASVQYQELTKDGAPRFPTRARVREDWDLS